MNSVLVILPLLASACLAAPGNLAGYAAAPAYAVAAPAVATYTVQVPVTKTVHYGVQNVVTGYTSQVIKPPTPALPIAAGPAFGVVPVAPAVVAAPAPAVVAGEFRQESSTTPSPPPQGQVPSTPCFPAVPGFPIPPGTTPCDNSQYPQIPGQQPAQPQPPPQPQQPQPSPEGSQPQPPSEPDQSQPPQDPEMPGSEGNFPGFPSFPAFPSFPSQQSVSISAPAPAPSPVAQAPGPVSPGAPAAVSDDTVLVENPEFRSAAPAPAIPAAGPAIPAQTYSAVAPAPVYSAPAVAPAPIAFGPTVTQQQVLAPVRTHTQITPQVTQVQPEAHVRKVVHNVPVDQPVYQTPVVHKTITAPQEVIHQTAYAAPAVQYAVPVAPALQYAAPIAPALQYAAPPQAIVQKVHY